jgi:hypothetical protein
VPAFRAGSTGTGTMGQPLDSLTAEFRTVSPVDAVTRVGGAFAASSLLAFLRGASFACVPVGIGQACQIREAPHAGGRELFQSVGRFDLLTTESGDFAHHERERPAAASTHSSAARSPAGSQTRRPRCHRPLRHAPRPRPSPCDGLRRSRAPLVARRFSARPRRLLVCRFSGVHRADHDRPPFFRRAFSSRDLAARRACRAASWSA